LAHELALRRLPDREAAIPVGGKDRFVIARERHCRGKTLALVGPLGMKKAELLGGGGFPQAKDRAAVLLLERHQLLAVRSISQTEHAPVLAPAGPQAIAAPQLAAGARFPETDRAIGIAARGDLAAIRGEGHAFDRARMSHRRPAPLTGGRIPEAN